MLTLAAAGNIGGKYGDYSHHAPCISSVSTVYGDLAWVEEGQWIGNG